MATPAVALGFAPRTRSSSQVSVWNRSMSFSQRLRHAWETSQSLLTVGLDPDPSRFPDELRNRPDAIYTFCREIIDATAPYACAFKPQIAYFAAQAAEDQLARICQYLRSHYPDKFLVLDAKRGDIGSTAMQYAIEAYDRYVADAVTINPYMGSDSIEPYLKWSDRGVFILCRTSNAGGSELQFLHADGEPLYLRVARLAAGAWQELTTQPGQIGLVVGATYPAEIAAVRHAVGSDMPLLIPGIGAQGGDIEATVKAGCNASGTGILINSSRAILYASRDNWQTAAAEAARATRDAINAVRAGATPGGV